MRRTIPAVVVILLATAGCSASTSSHPGPTAVKPTATVAAKTVKPLTAAQITQRLKSAGLGVTGVIVYTAATDENHLLGRQGGYTSKTAWVDPAAKKAGDTGGDPGGTEHGGGIEVFPTAAGAADRLNELKSFKPPLGDGYDYQTGTAVLRVSYYLTPAQEAAYKKSFDTITGS